MDDLEPDLRRIPVERKTGEERLRLPDGVPGPHLIDFWVSRRFDLVSDTNRAIRFQAN
jgi:hypothetical protein